MADKVIREFAEKIYDHFRQEYEVHRLSITGKSMTDMDREEAISALEQIIERVLSGDADMKTELERFKWVK